MSRRKIKTIRGIFRALAALSFIYIYGVVGGLELGGMTIKAGVIHATIATTATLVFSYLGGLWRRP